MKPGEVTVPIRSTRGYQILKLETLKEAAVQPFDSVRDLVAERVHNERQRQEIRKFLTRVRGQAIIEWKNEELKKLYGLQRIGPATGVKGRFYAISVEKKVRHPAVAAICEAARESLFAT